MLPPTNNNNTNNTTTTTITTTNNTINNNTITTANDTTNNNDVMMKTDEHTLREVMERYHRQALHDKAVIQALEIERDALLSAASAMRQSSSQGDAGPVFGTNQATARDINTTRGINPTNETRALSSSDVQSRGAQMFSPVAGTWTPNHSDSQRRMGSRNTPILNTPPVGIPFSSTSAMQYDDSIFIRTIQKDLVATITGTATAATTATVASNQSYLHRIQELEEKLRVEAEQTAVILSQRDTFAMSKSALTAKLAGNCRLCSISIACIRFNTETLSTKIPL